MTVSGRGDNGGLITMPRSGRHSSARKESTLDFLYFRGSVFMIMNHGGG